MLTRLYDRFIDASHKENRDDIFLQEAIDLFSGKRQGHLIHRCYMSSAALFFGGQFSSTPHNYMKPGEISAIYNSKARVGELVKHENGAVGIENGPGMETAMRSKSAPFFSAMPGLHTYIGRDYSDMSIDMLKIIMAEELPHATIIGDRSNYLTDPLPSHSKGRKIISEFGMTTGNMEGKPEDGFPYETIKANIAAQKRHMDDGDIYTVPFDCNQNGDEVEAAYNSQWTTLWGRELFKLMKAELPVSGDFDPEAFTFKSIWDGTSHASHNYMIAQRDMSFKIASQKFDIKKGDKFGITNSYKMPVTYARKIADELDLKLEMFYSDDKRIAMPVYIR